MDSTHPYYRRTAESPEDAPGIAGDENTVHEGAPSLPGECISPGREAPTRGP